MSGGGVGGGGSGHTLRTVSTSLLLSAPQHTLPMQTPNTSPRLPPPPTPTSSLAPYQECRELFCTLSIPITQEQCTPCRLRAHRWWTKSKFDSRSVLFHFHWWERSDSWWIGSPPSIWGFVIVIVMWVVQLVICHCDTWGSSRWWSLDVIVLALLRCVCVCVRVCACVWTARAC